MKRFRFRLGRLERLRRMARRESRAELAASLAKLTACRVRRESLATARVDAESSWHETVLHPVVDGRDLRAAAERLQSASAAVEAAWSAERAALLDVESTRRDYVEKSRRHRVLERLHDKARQRWMEQGDREEQRQFDELHLLRKRGRAPARGR